MFTSKVVIVQVLLLAHRHPAIEIAALCRMEEAA